MTIENKIARLMRNTGPARFFVPVGLILIVFGIILFGFKSDNFVETTGRITSVVENIDADSQKGYDVGFSYTANGAEYDGQFDNLSGNYAEGADIAVFYNPDNPEQITNAKTSPLFAPILIALGILSIILGILQTTKAFRKSKALDRSIPNKGASRNKGTSGGKVPARTGFKGYKDAPGVTEYYFRFDGNSLKPGYIIEDGNRKPLYEGKMAKNALVGARSFEFIDHTTGKVSEHQIGHTMTNSYNDEFFSVSSWFKFDGENVWDVLHARGLRMSTNLHSKFPRIIYEVTRNGAAFARIETSTIYVHEEDEAKHKLAIPTGNMYYRFWTASEDFDSLFLTIFAISETEQAIVE